MNEEDKPWLFQAIPEMNKKSAKDICLKLKKSLCIILFSKEQPSKEVLDEMKALKKEYTSKRSRLKFNFVWMNSSVHNEWRKKLDLEDIDMQVRVLRVGRRNKYITMKGPYS